MATPQLAFPESPARHPILFNTADEIVTVLESQLEGFRSLHAITCQMKEKFARSGGAALARGLQERNTCLEQIRQYEQKLNTLKLQWRTYSDVPAMEQDERIQRLVEECQSIITQITEMDQALHASASERRRAIQVDLAEMHQRRQPLTAYLTHRPASTTHTIPVSGHSVDFADA